MHITLETDYALRIVDCLARDGGRVGAKVISERTCVTLRFSLKILRKLVSSGIVRSYKGALGGYEIAKPLSMITVYDVLETIEGPYLLSRCLGDGHECNRLMTDGYCAYHELFSTLSEQVRRQLKLVSIEQTIGKAEENIVIKEKAR